MSLDANMPTNLIILAGGASSRMKKSQAIGEVSEEEISQANLRSKALITMDNGGRPLLDYLLYNAREAGYQNIYLVVGEKDALFKSYYGQQRSDNDFHGLKLSYATQHIPSNRVKPLGTADALFQAIEQYPALITQQFTVCNSDNLYSVNALKDLRITQHPNAFISYDREALDFTSERIARFAVAQVDEQGYLKNIVEKPAVDAIPRYQDKDGKVRVSMNIFKLDGAMVYPYLKDCPVHPERDEKELPTAILNMVKDHPRSVLGIPMSEHVPDLTAKEDIAKVKAYLKQHYGPLNWDG